MTKRIGMAVALGALLAACGGNSGGNAAAGKTFNYGAPTAASATQSSALQSQLSGALALQGSPNASGAQGFADFSGVTSTLLSSSGVGLGFLQANSPAQRQALQLGVDAASRRLTTSGTFDNPSCAVVTASSVAFQGCTITISDVTATSSVTGTVHVNGTFTLSADRQTLTWDLTVQADVVETGSGFTMNGSARFHDSGTLTVTATTIKGDMLAELGVSATANGQSASMAVNEALLVDLTYTQVPECVTGGTLEAKRVWTQRPQGATAAQLPDGAAKVTWAGCGVATIQVSQ